jgi:hypothetical protein
VIEHELDYLVTLTTRANVEDYDLSLRMKREFVKLVRAKIAGWKACGVPERQERGAFHWHLAVHGWQDLFTLRHTWGIICQDYTGAGGNVDIKAPRKFAGKGKWHVGRLAGYLSKYITKAMESERDGMKGRHRYSAPYGIKTWAEFACEFPADVTVEKLLVAFAEFLGDRGANFVWAPYDRPGQGWCSSA